MRWHLTAVIVALGLAMSLPVVPSVSGEPPTPMQEAVHVLRQYAAARAEGRTGPDVEGLLQRADRLLASAEAQMGPDDPLREREVNLRTVVSTRLEGAGPRYRDATLMHVFGPGAASSLYAPFHDRGLLLPHVSSQLIDKHMFLSRRTSVLRDCVTPVCGPLEGKAVADVGCGVGAFLPFLLESVGPAGRVWAEDIQADAIQFVRLLPSYGLEEFRRVNAVVGTASDPGLPRGALDVIFLNNMPCLRARPKHKQESLAFLARMHEALREDGRLVVVMKVIKRNDIGNACLLLREGGFRVVKSARNHAPSHDYFSLAAVRVAPLAVPSEPSLPRTHLAGSDFGRLLRNLRVRPKKRDKLIALLREKMRSAGMDDVDGRVARIAVIFDRTLALDKGAFLHQERELAQALGDATGGVLLGAH